MSKLRLHGTSSGYTDIAPTAAAGNNTLTAPTGTGTIALQGSALSGTTGTFTGDVDIADKIVHTGDTNTAIRFPAADTITAETGGSERLRIDSSGHVNISGITTAKVFVPTEGQLSNRNLIINGAMQVAQRGTTSGTEGYSTIDRFSNEEGSCDEVPTQSQHALTSSDTGPWEEGFRHSFHIQNGNQTSGAQAANFIKLSYLVEAQDMATSGWNYTSTSSYITLSFWVKSSVAQNFYGRLTTKDGTQLNYPFETGSLSADTWTKVTKTIPGHANISMNNDTGAGLLVEWMTYRGGNTTSPSVSLNTWAAYASGTRTPDQTSTWFTTNDATFEVTGVQLEVGSAATPFEHRSYQDEFLRCCRYYYKLERRFTAAGRGAGSSAYLASISTPVPFRAQPTIGTGTNSESESFNIRVYKYDGTSDSTATPTVGTGGWMAGNNHITIYQGSHSVVDDRVLNIYLGGGYIDFNSELT